MNQNKSIAKRILVAKSVAWVFLITSLLMLAYTYYRAEITFHGNRDVFYFKYYLISLAGILFWGVVLRLTDEIKLNIEMVFVGLVVGLYLVEIALHFIAPITAKGNSVLAAKEAGVEFDTRTRYRIYQDLMRKGVGIEISARPNLLTKTGGLHKKGAETLFPFGGVSKKSTVGDNESGKYEIFLSDRYGFNNPDSEWDSSQIEWLLTGDSFAEGITVSPKENISGQIRKITSQSVISLGTSGNGPLIELAVLKEYAVSIKPNTVLWVYYEGNDLSSNLKEEKSSPILMRYLQPGFSQDLIKRQTEIDKRIRKFITEAEARADILSNTKILRLYNIRTRMFAVDNDIDVDIEPLFTEILKKARDLTVAWGGKFFFVYLPAFERYATVVNNHDLYRKRS